ncbi:uncharacterized protein MYCFIDRAFT_136563 [Pseudocercospora fijiensis CIRAD86]|uniref:DUF155 domain-containing protein n=1 Tax=Pseudocercospora fijiensis (strain CIRAD86) TaxID=383855 RepID=M3B1I5_PSEFD|nr:uncharacterized protein MYCFIDRAFT_136563 [Pseudocercospora fijiensis CIRAD86]EME83257.1 hypothetical protein MYCFIDRAFT_136563 [Pseudocercospora fijiensis CIRAD86]
MSIAPPRPKRGPSVLVTDARETRPQAPRPQPQRTGTRIISVDHVLQYASEIPSAQRRLPPGQRPAHHNRTPSGRHPLAPKLSGQGIPIGGAHIPARSSKTSEKLVLLPETSQKNETIQGFEEEDDSAPPRDDELRRRRLQIDGKSHAERLSKTQREADEEIKRTTAYCTAQSYKLRQTATFVRDQHGAKTKLYDDCLYCVYQLPLLGGSDGYRVRSSPVLKNPGGRSVLDEQIEANERRQYREGWGEESEEYSVRDNYNPASPPPEMQQQDVTFPSPHAGISPNAHTVAELFIFSYGVAVLWNFTPNQEKDLLADLTFSATSALHLLPGGKHERPLSQKAAASLPPLALPLMTRPLDESDFETEEFHFQYDETAEKPRIYNDMITLRTSDHMIKLAMSHAIAQSTKLSFFEERMQRTMESAQYVPRRLALEGRLGMDRKEIVGLVGRLFEGRVDVNLSSNMLDTPNFFWDAEPTLHPLYAAVREYLEIKPRIQVLNERCRVFLDLAEILSDSIADVKMTRITWIIIVLIILSILVTCTEVFLRFGILAAGKNKKGADNAAMLLQAGLGRISGEL